MHQEATDELTAGELHGFALLAVGVILVLKANLSVFEFQQSPIRNRNTMGVPGQISEHLLGSAEGALRIDDPVSLYRFINLPFECGWLFQSRQLAIKL